MRWYKALPALLLSAFLLTACSTPQTVPEASSALPSSSGAPVSSIPEAPPSWRSFFRWRSIPIRAKSRSPISSCIL